MPKQIIYFGLLVGIVGCTQIPAPADSVVVPSPVTFMGMHHSNGYTINVYEDITTRARCYVSRADFSSGTDAISCLPYAGSR